MKKKTTFISIYAFKKVGRDSIKDSMQRSLYRCFYLRKKQEKVKRIDRHKSISSEFSEFTILPSNCRVKDYDGREHHEVYFGFKY